MGEVVDDVELVLLPAPGAAEFYGVTDPDDIAWMDERLTPHPWACFEQKLDMANEDEVWALPTFHIVCESTIPTRNKAMIESATAEGRLWTIDTGHDLMVTEPDFVANALIEIDAIDHTSAGA
jgi:pimeloyl-ACP methyl ester carboxylesterase